MQDPRRLGLILSLLAAALIIAAGVVTLLGLGTLSLVLIALGLLVGLVGVVARQRPRAAPVPVAPVDTARIRAEREDHGEVAAVRMLRTARPELSLLDATRIVRGL